jgi:hypothetical protein
MLESRNLSVLTSDHKRYKYEQTKKKHNNDKKTVIITTVVTSYIGNQMRDKQREGSDQRGTSREKGWTRMG